MAESESLVRCEMLINRMKELKLSIGRCAKETGIGRRTLIRYRQGEALDPEEDPVRCLAIRLGLDAGELMAAIKAAARANADALDATQNGASISGEESVDRNGHIRRQLLLTGVATATVTAGSSFATALLSPLFWDGAEPDLAPLRAALRQAKRAYHGCQHDEAAAQLQMLVPQIEAGERCSQGDEQLLWGKVVAEAYQVSTSVLLRFGNAGLALMTADRSLRAAERSESRTAIAASARVMTHALMRSSETVSAADFAAGRAVRLGQQVEPGGDGPDLWSVRGALLLRGAEAAAESGRSSQAESMLAEAAELAERVGEGADHMGTGFNPGNVLAHQMAIELTLGNAGRAIEVAKNIHLPGLASTERQAAVQLDIARAFAQWGKYDLASHALWEVERIAPQELCLRDSAKRVIRSLQLLAPRTVKSDVERLVERVGVEIAL